MTESKKYIVVCGSHLFTQQLIMPFIRTVSREGKKYGYGVIVFSYGSDSSGMKDESLVDQDLANLINFIPVSSLVILADTIKVPSLLSYILEICHKKNIPVFCVNGQYENCYNMVMKHGDGFELALRHVIEAHGCRRIHMLAGFMGNEASEERIAVYKKVLAEKNIPLEEERIDYGDFWEEPAKKAVYKLLQSNLPLPEAIVCANDSMAIAACSVLHEHGFQVPEDIIVTGFDGIPGGQLHFPVLTTCEPDFMDAATFIVHETEVYVTSGTFTPHDHDIVFVPKIEQSCGCKPKKIDSLNQVLSTLCNYNSDSDWHNYAMNQLITANLDNDNLLALPNLIQEHTHFWLDHFRFACIKASMILSHNVEDELSEMISIFNLRSGDFSKTGEIFTVDEFIPRIEEIQDLDILLVKLLNSGKTVYGYTVEGFKDIDERSMHRCNDFAFFLSYCINTILHNRVQKALNTDLIKAHLEVSMMALHDSMTGLYNRQGFFKEITPLLTSDTNIGKYLYIFSIDMNRLKYINDTFGHSEGDFAITTLAHAISKTMGELAVCARFGGDEFIAAIVSEGNTTYSVSEFTQKLLSCVETTEGVAKKPYPIRASVGMYCLPISLDMNLENMIASADEAMYEMKRNDKERAALPGR